MVSSQCDLNKILGVADHSVCFQNWVADYSTQFLYVASLGQGWQMLGDLTKKIVFHPFFK